MKVLITGGTGFLGKHLCIASKHYGHSPIPLGRKDVNLMDYRSVEAIFLYLKPDCIIHAAAKCGGIGANREAPAEFLKDNLIMNSNVLEASKTLNKLYPIKKFVGLGSVCMYPSHTPVPFKENDIWNGYPEPTNAPYGIAKRVFLTQVQTYRQQYNFPAVFVIPVNMFGPEDHFGLQHSHVIPALIRKFDAAKRTHCPVELWGTGQASREFLFAKDAAEGVLLALERYDKNEPVNLGTGQEITIRELAEKIQQMVGYNGNIVWNDEMPDGQERRCLDVSRAKAFGFMAKTSLDDGLKQTIKWYNKNKKLILKKGEK